MEYEKRGVKTHLWIYTVLIIALITLMIWGFNNRRTAMAHELNIENSYNRAFSELVDYIDNIDIKLTKAQLAHTPAQLASIANDIFSEASEAKSCLGQLPTSLVQFEKTSKFLSQVGDYTYVLSQAMINGEEISQEEYNTLAQLNDYASQLKENLSQIQAELYSGNIKLSQINNTQGKNTVSADGSSLLDSLENVEKAFDEYPSLIYDGPFSEHIENRNAAMLENADEISENEALETAKNFIGEAGKNLQSSGSTDNTKLNAYNFHAAGGSSQISVSVTKKGGHILYYLNNISVIEEKLTVDEASQKAMEFLESNGFHSMSRSYYEKTGNIATINYAYSQNNVIYYSDLVKVRVSLADGQIVGFESKGYLMNHTERSLNEPALTAEEAKASISPSLNVTSSGLALIPKDSLEEVLCYEFKGSFKDRNFIIYVNADNGREENILLLLESEEGILTI